MLSNHIYTWLNEDGSFTEGLVLHSRVGQSRTHESLRTYLSFHIIPQVAMDQLTADLRTYLINNPPSVVVPAVVDPVAPPRKTSQPKVDTQLPQAIKDLHAHGKALLKERDAHRAQLVQQAQHPDKFTNNDRHLTAKVVMEVQAEIDDVYLRIERYHSEGQLPAAGSTRQIVAETVQKMNRMGSLRSAISRLNKRLKAPESARHKQQLEAEKLAKEVELNDISIFLGLKD